MKSIIDHKIHKTGKTCENALRADSNFEANYQSKRNQCQVVLNLTLIL